MVVLPSSDHLPEFVPLLDRSQIVSGEVLTDRAERQRRALDIVGDATRAAPRKAARRLPDGGGIVNVAARAGLTGGNGSAAYAVTKAAVVRLTQVLALELAERRIRVNAVVPALIDTPANRAHGITGGTPPAEIARTVAFLLSDDARAVNGAIVPV